MRMVCETVEADPTDLRPGDVVAGLSDRGESGCHCDVVVTVHRHREEA